jgi:hypothetical protein
MVLLSALTGCASVSSVKVDDKHHAEGLAYFLPRRDVVLKVTVPEKPGPLQATVDTTDPMPDLGAAFVAQIPRSQIAKINSTLQVNAHGLLNSDSTGAATSNLNSILQSLAGIQPALKTMDFAPTVQSSCSVGDHSMVVGINEAGNGWVLPKPASNVEFCNVRFELTNPMNGTAPAGFAPAAGKSAPGLYYRIQLPYVVRATPTMGAGPLDSRDFLVFSPTRSPTYLLPVARAGFGNNTASFSFDNGVPLKYGQSIDSELAGVVQLPATLVKAYFQAIGEMFTARKGPIDSEKGYLDALNQLAAAQEKRLQCLAALETKDDKKISDACK